MGNENNPTPGTNGGVPNANPAPAAANAGVSPEVVEELKAHIADLQKQVKFAVTKLTKGATPPAEPQDPADPTPAPRQTAADKELATRLERLEKERERTARNAKRNELKAFFSEIGITGDELQDAIDLFETRNGAKLIHDEESGEVRIKFSEIYEPKTLREYLGEENKAGKFNRYKAGRATPQTGPSKNATGGIPASGEVQMTFKEFQAASLRMTNEQRSRVKVID